MNINFSDELILGIAIGIALSGAALYIFLQFKEYHYIKKLKQWFYKWLPHLKQEKQPPLLVKTKPVHFTDNLNKEKVHLELHELLQLLDLYQTHPTAILLEKIHPYLDLHTEHGDNLLHEYIQQEGAEVEKVKEILEIEPELLFEENAEGETLLIEAEKSEKFEIAEFLIEEKHFHSHEQRHDYLKHADHHGNTALHTIAHLWHDYENAEMWHFVFDHFMHMIQTHPVGSLLWKNDEGKAVYEYLFHLDAEQKKKLIEALLHKGVLHENDGHLTISPQIRNEIMQENPEKTNIATLAELFLIHYPQSHHEQSLENVEVKTSGRHYKYDPPHPS